MRGWREASRDPFRGGELRGDLPGRGQSAIGSCALPSSQCSRSGARRSGGHLRLAWHLPREAGPSSPEVGRAGL